MYMYMYMHLVYMLLCTCIWYTCIAIVCCQQGFPKLTNSCSHFPRIVLTRLYNSKNGKWLV